MQKFGFLFDLDGVIIDSESEYSRIWAQINKEYPTGIKSLEEVIKGTTLENILATHYPDDKIKEKVKKRLYELEKLMKYEYLPGAHEFLLLLKEKGYPMALVTSSDNAKMEHLKEELPDLMPLFDVIITAERITKSKPDPEGYLKAASDLGVNIKNSFVFEDSLQGVKAGNNAGAFVVGKAGTLPAEKLLPYSDLIIETFEGLNLNNLLHRIEQNE